MKLVNTMEEKTKVREIFDIMKDKINKNTDELLNEVDQDFEDQNED